MKSSLPIILTKVHKPGVHQYSTDTTKLSLTFINSGNMGENNDRIHISIVASILCFNLI
jgi:hypothetical protein